MSATSEVLLAVARGPLGFARTVVLKRLLVEVGTEDAALASARLGREARAYARLAHPAIVRLYDFVEDEGRLTLVLEHVDGLSLAAVIAGLRACGDDVDETAVWYIGYRIFLALAAAHSARDPLTRELATVIHRDVSPGNVLVPWDGYVKLADFGVARIAGVPGDTRPGVVKGTSGYLAPEQVRGEPATVRTDVYAACLLMRELLLRTAVFPREHRSELELLSAMAAPDLVPLAALRPALPVHVTDAIDRGLAPDPEARGLTAEEMASLLRSVVIDVEAAREQLAEKIARLRRREESSSQTTPRATRADVEPSIFDESATLLEEVTDTAPGHAHQGGSQQAITSRPPPPTSMVMPRMEAPSIKAPRPPPGPPIRWETSSPMIFETPNVMTTEVLGDARREPRRRRSSLSPLLLVAAAAAVGSGILIGAVLGMRERAMRATATMDAKPSAAPPPSRALALPPALPLAPAPALPPAPAPALPPALPPALSPAPASTTGRVLTSSIETGHRIFVDGRFTGSGGAPLVVRCGKHDVRVGSAGRLRHVVVPCGGDVEVTR